jgi:hypothetical protein
MATMVAAKERTQLLVGADTGSILHGKTLPQKFLEAAADGATDYANHR